MTRLLPGGPARLAGPSLRRWRRLPDWHVLPPPDPALQISVVVPVRDEAAGLRATLLALAAQCDAGGARFDSARFEVIVLANNCSDASAEVVRRFAASRPRLRLHVVEVTFPRPLAHVGHARRCLMNEACRRLERTAGDGGVIASTDGDTRVAPDWLAATLAEVRAGADAVGGRIALDGSVEVGRGLARMARRDELYQRLRVRLEHALDPDPGDPWPRHHQHFGASLALTTRAYRHVGGLPAEPYLEDEALFQALRQHDLTVRHSRRVNVVTSSRREGRVAVGLSWQLREWAILAQANARADAAVFDPLAWVEELALKRRLRACWQASQQSGAGRSAERSLQTVAAELRMSAAWLGRRLGASATFGAVWHEVASRRQRKARRPVTVPMTDAIATLRRLLAMEGVLNASSADRVGRSRDASRRGA